MSSPNPETESTPGNQANPFGKVAITRGRENLSLRGICSCAVRINCKHVAATLVHWLNIENQPAAGADSVSVWQTALDNRNEEEVYLAAEAVVVLYRIRQIRVQQEVRYTVAAFSARKLRSGGLGKSSPLALDRRHFDSAELRQ